MRTLFLTLITCLFVLPAYAQYSGGTGEPNDPYQIATAEDLMLLGETPEDYDKHFILTTDIDLDPNLPGRKVFDRAVIAPGWETPFIGVFDGNGRTISHLTIEGSDYLGLCGQVGSWDARAGGIRNLGLADVNIVGSGDCIGGLVGSNGRFYSDGGTVTHCYSTGSVSGNQSVGGLVGSNMGEVANCHSTGTVRGGSSVGGLLGENRGDVTNCYSKSTVVGDYDSVGGLVGKNGGVFLVLFSVTPCGSITQCYSTGAVTGTEDVGGLVGANPGNVLNCYSTSAVSADSGVGGLVGVNWVMPYSDTNATIDGLITNCYSTGVVIGNSDVGGLVGVGALFYSNEGRVIRSFWDIETSGQTASADGRCLPTVEMQTASTFQLWGTCGEGIWTIDEGNDYPRLSWENLPGEAIYLSPLSDLLLGTGTQSDPFLINTAEELYLLRLFPCELDKCFKLTGDVDLSGFDGKEGRPAFEVIGNRVEAFTGVFDGNGYTISNLTINGDSYLGLFVRLESGAEIKNLGVVDVNIIGTGDCVATLVGLNAGTVSQCYSTGVVCGNYYVGGLVGLNHGNITQSYSTAVVNASDGDVGGLVGLNWGVVAKCYSMCTVGGDYSVGGLVGDNYSSVNQCYSKGVVIGIYDVGGLVGSNGGSVNQSFSMGAVSGNSYVGGLVGFNRSNVSKSYSTGAVSGKDIVGGLVGYNWPHTTVNQSYSNGIVIGESDIGGLVGYGFSDDIVACFWDTQTSGQTWSRGGIGLTTDEMQTAKTFLDADWDFVDETTNGTEDIWWLLEGQDYPRLWWEDN